VLLFREIEGVLVRPIKNYERASATKWTILIRVGVGIVFASEGIQKLLFPAALGSGRFAKIGIPAPDLVGPFVGTVETICGVLVLAGAFTRAAALPLMIIMVVALASTKVPILLGHGYLIFSNPPVPETGFWSMLHEARTDLSMLLASTFLLIVGPGAWSIDAVGRWRSRES
jgi:putative oxidoreductase